MYEWNVQKRRLFRVEGATDLEQTSPTWLTWYVTLLYDAIGYIKYRTEEERAPKYIGRFSENIS